ncbi:zinc finger protein 99-like [Pygocentrus nattereri]|uniref:C2H2-type domain-containing protein n=1 Tax=Pygocentrus nattereri TaxID=42514 RepID=A0A3B4DGT1_PYGNA|nr:zinc finger protein 99-like [Pygocentrus nattereri]
MQAPEGGAELFLHCLVPPVRLLSAAIWHLIQQEDVPNYGVLEEFVSLVTDTIPDLLSYRQKAQLTIGLRARLVLELCSMERPADPDIVQAHLQHIQNLLSLNKELESSDAYVEESGTNFVAVVQILMKDAAERSMFFKNVFPLQYGAKFNMALKKLMWLFLSRLENALPQPTLEEIAHMLITAPTVMEECVQSISQSHQLRNLFKHQRAASVENKEKSQLWSTTPDDCILSCLGSPQLVQVVIEEQIHLGSQSEPVLDYPPSYSQEVQVESVVIAQYIDDDLGTGSNICDENVDGIECFDADDNKEYELHSLDKVDTENVTEVVYEQVESGDLRAIDFVLEESSEKQDTLKSEVTVEDIESCNGIKEITVCQENSVMPKDCVVDNKTDCGKIELTHECASYQCGHISATTEEAITNSNDMLLESKELSGLVTSCLVKQPCVKLDRLDMTGKPFPQPEPPKRGRGRPRKGTQDKKPLCKGKEQDTTVAEPCASFDKQPEIKNVSSVFQKLKKTYIEVKGSSVVYACSLCNFQDSEEKQLHHHFIVHHPEDYEQLCKTEEEKNVHTSAPNHSESQNKPITKIRLYRGIPVCKTCPICGKTFTRSSDMRRHQTSHTVARPFTCLYCEKTFRYSFDLRRHQQHACANQGYVVLNQSNVNEVTENSSETSPISSNENKLPNFPAKQQTTRKQDTIFCRVCRITLPNSSSLKSHMETHSEGFLHTCPCGKTYKYLENMRIHQIVCPEADLHKSEQKQCDEDNSLKNNEVVITGSRENYPQDLPNLVKSSEEPHTEGPEATRNSSPGPGTVSDLGDQILHVAEEKSVTEASKPTISLTSSSVCSDMRRHLRSPSGAHPHKCSQCGDSFKYSYNLKKHEDVCEGKKQPKVAGQFHAKEHNGSSNVASSCKSIEATNSTLDPLLSKTPSSENMKEDDDQEWQEHKASSTKAIPCGSVFTCEKCDKKCKDLFSLKKHKKTCDSKEQRYKCVKCGSLFRTLLEVRKHVHAHWGEDPLQCSKCGKYFQNPSELSKHKVVHERERSYPCTLCLDTFGRLDDLRQHYHEVHELKGPYQCPHCDKAHADLGSMVVHVRTHNDERPYHCPHCSKRFKHRSGLNVHEKLHSGDRPFLCEECGKCFSNKIQLQRHSVSHRNERPYTCSECKKCFKSQHALRGHFLKHSKPANIPCEFCGKVFSQASALDRHHRTHTGERPYRCPKCDKTFLTSGEVGKHLRYHTGERPFQCTLCSKSFTQTCYLTAHMRIHTGERPYICSVCDKGFVCNTHLKRHMFVHTKEKPFKCDCGKAFNRTNLLRVHQKSQCFLEKK